MRRAGVDVELVSPLRWNEGGADVSLGDAEAWVVPCRTFGRHPYLFLYNPVPIARKLLTQRFDVIDVHEEPASLAAFELRLLSRLRHGRVPMLMYGAQNLEKRYPWPFRWIERHSFRRIAAVYPCNRAAGDIFRRRGFRGLVRVLPLGVSVDAVAPMPPAKFDAAYSGRVVIGYVGRLEEYKGVQVLLRALARLPERFCLDAVGDGGHRAELEALALSLGVADRVKFLGHRSQHDVNRMYADFDLLAVPSQTRPNWVEQFGRIVVEAMAAGVPMVVADSGSLPEVAAGVAVVVPESDDERWAAAIRDLSDDASERSRRSALGLRRAVDFDWAEIARRHVDLYREVLA